MNKELIYLAEQEILKLPAKLDYKLVLLKNHEDNIILRDGKVEKKLRATSPSTSTSTVATASSTRMTYALRASAHSSRLPSRRPDCWSPTRRGRLPTPAVTTKAAVRTYRTSTLRSPRLNLRKR